MKRLFSARITSRWRPTSDYLTNPPKHPSRTMGNDTSTPSQDDEHPPAAEINTPTNTSTILPAEIIHAAAESAIILKPASEVTATLWNQELIGPCMEALREMEGCYAVGVASWSRNSGVGSGECLWFLAEQEVGLVEGVKRLNSFMADHNLLDNLQLFGDKGTFGIYGSINKLWDAHRNPKNAYPHELVPPGASVGSQGGKASGTLGLYIELELEGEDQEDCIRAVSNEYYVLRPLIKQLYNILRPKRGGFSWS